MTFVVMGIVRGMPMLIMVVLRTEVDRGTGSLVFARIDQFKDSLTLVESGKMDMAEITEITTTEVI